MATNGGQFRVIQGGGHRSGPTLVKSRAAGESAVRRLVGRDGLVLSANLAHTHQVLTQELGFRLIARETGGVRPGGYQLFYLKDGALVRIKTTGTERRPRAHMTVSVSNHTGIGWDDEKAKFNAAGMLRPKTLVGGANPVGTPFRVIQNGLTTQEQDDWAAGTHFDFPANFDCSAAGGLLVTP